ncbi:hypothetical protein QCA50_017321 [Cerrena zonata]|uniref:Enoyl reductase (ER) domain-containing protein n=1 Tax=Cerrena zonata TaxID=2478898 RepID=A0AAW0FKS2_9APHY
MSIPTQQKALLVPSAKADFVLQTIEVPKPEADEVLIRLDAVALNPVDYKMQKDGFYLTKFPAIVGCDAAGVVVEVGAKVTNRAVGDKLAFQTTPGYRSGGYQQFAPIKAALTFKVPSHMSIDQAATFPACLVTAAHALYTDYVPDFGRGGLNLTPFWKEGGDHSGKSIVILGGSSANGQYALQFARLSKFTNIITTGSAHNKEFLLSLGATHFVDRNLGSVELIAQIQQVTGGPVPIVYDSVSTDETQNIAYDLLTSDGTLLITLPPAIDQTKIAPNKKVYIASGFLGVPFYTAIDTELLDVLPGLLDSGDLKPLTPEIIPGGLSGIPGGLKRLINNEVSARKLVVHPAETA